MTSSCFNKFWPLILAKNDCNISDANTSKFFVPERKFDHVWAHELLASKAVGDYYKPLELICKETCDTAANVEAPIQEITQLPYRNFDPIIVPLEQQIAAVEQDVAVRRKLAFDFANRKFPWYIQRPWYCCKFNITEEMKKTFDKPFEFDILRNLHKFQCNLIIIDVAEYVDFDDLERWLKFAPYAAIITIIHCSQLFQKIRDFGRVFMPVLMKEDPANTWHLELNRAVKLGVQTAKELYLFDDGGKSFVFIFSNNRNICTCDQFKILRKF